MTDRTPDLPVHADAPDQAALRPTVLLGVAARIWMRHALTLLALGAAASLPIAFAQQGLLHAAGTSTPQWLPWQSPVGLGLFALDTFVTAVLAAVVAHATFSALAGEPVRLLEGLRFAMSRLGTVFLAACLLRLLFLAAVAPLIAGFAWDLGWLVGAGVALVVPALVVVTARAGLVVAAAALEPERGAVGALGRAWQLTAGSDTFINLVGLVLLFLLSATGLVAVLATLGQLLFRDPRQLLEFVTVFATLWIATFVPCLAAVTYHSLRRDREGGTAAGFLGQASR